MSKLLELKEWITIPEAAEHLSRIFEETVTGNDIFQLILAKHLSPSLFSGATIVAKRASIVTYDQLTEEDKSCFASQYGDESRDVVFFVEKNTILLPKGLYDFHSGYEDFISSHLHRSFIEGKKFEESFFQKSECYWSFYLSSEDKFFFVTFTTAGSSLFPEEENILNPHIQIVIRTKALEKVTTKEGKPRIAPEEIIEQERKAGRGDREIVATIDAQWTGTGRLTNEMVGRLLPANPGTYLTPASHAQRGKRLRRIP